MLEEQKILSIGTAEDLLAFAENVNTGNYSFRKELTVNLTADIDLGGTGYYIDAGGVVGNVQGHSTVARCLNRGVVDANEYDFDFAFITVGDIVGRREGQRLLSPSSHEKMRSGPAKQRNTGANKEETL